MAQHSSIGFHCVGGFVVLLLAACGGGGGSGGSSPAPLPTWTVFVYAHADHNLSPSLVTDLAEMTSAEIGSHVRVVVLADWDSSQGNPGGYEWLQIRGEGGWRRISSGAAQKPISTVRRCSPTE